MGTAVHVVVTGLAGPRCTVEASTEWTILQVHNAICDKTRIPVDWQTLLKGTEKLGWEVQVGSLISEELELTLTLLVEEVPTPKPTALREALERKDAAAALKLLRLRKLPGLNEIDDSFEFTMLHMAIEECLQEVAMALLARADFCGINVADRAGRTALHYAASLGNLPVCRAMLSRSDFTNVLAVDNNERTASQLARVQGHEEVADFLAEAEAQFQGGET